jgi:hypothetical protein
VRVYDAEAIPQCDILLDLEFEEFCLPGPGCANRVQMDGAVIQRDLYHLQLLGGFVVGPAET